MLQVKALLEDGTGTLAPPLAFASGGRRGNADMRKAFSPANLRRASSIGGSGDPVDQVHGTVEVAVFGELVVAAVDMRYMSNTAPA